MRRLPQLSALQVIELQDALLSNADQLLQGASAVLELSNVGLARSLAILGMEESGKAIAIHQRRVRIAYEPEGSPFVNDELERVWASHEAKLRIVHAFLVEEPYWFGYEPPDYGDNLAALGAIKGWARRHNKLKQRGFYVDLDQSGGVLEPGGVPDPETLSRVIAQVHQIGWQLRLGEHIEARKQAEDERDVPPMSEEDIELLHQAMLKHGGDIDGLVETLRQGQPGTPLANDSYRLRLRDPESDPFEKLGERGYEAQTRELARLANEREHRREPG